MHNAIVATIRRDMLTTLPLSTCRSAYSSPRASARQLKR